METVVYLVVLACVVLAGTALGERTKLPPPLLLITLGVAGSYLPFVPQFHLEPEIVLIGLLPPLLYTAALQTSLVDFRANVRPIMFLSVGLVVVTTLAVGGALVMIVPGLGWPAALAIGAVVAPPDAVAATAIARRIGLPRRVVTVLEGESLVNDATALVALRTAIVALAASVTVTEVALDFAIAAGGGVLAGVVVFFTVARVRRQVTDPLLDTVISLLVPYVAFLAAEAIDASGVIAVVVAGLLLGHKAPIIQTAQSRITERTTWRSIAFLLENSVFLLIGLQAHWIIDGIAQSSLGIGLILGVCALTLVTVIVTRMVAVLAIQILLLPREAHRRTWPEGVLVGWAGMRGVVTLAAAFILPANTPHREVLLLIAFTVVAGTLFLQGLTLPSLTRRMDVPAPDPAADALARAALLERAGAAGLARLDSLDLDDVHGVTDLVRKRIDERSFAAWERLGTLGGQEAPSALYARARMAMLDAERAEVLAVRSTGKVPSEVVNEVLVMLDIEESIVEGATDTDELRAAALRPEHSHECAELEAHPASITAAEPAPACAACVAEGTPWVALRRCLDCGHVGCCDSSPGRHATAHFRSTHHPVMQSAEPGELWRWCYVHHLTG